MALRTALEIVEWRAAATPDQTVLTDESGAAYTYRDLAVGAGAVAAAWAAAGIARGDRVAILARNSGAFLVQVLGLNRLGAIPVLLNWRLSPAEVADLLALSSASGVYADVEFTRLVPDDPGLVRRAAGPVSAPGWEQFSPSGPPPPRPPVDRDALFVMLHTSGTTGQPKLIPLTGDGQLASVTGLMLRAPALGGGRRHLRFAPMFHMAGLGGVLLPVVVGDVVHVLGSFHPPTFVDLVESLRIEFTNAPPAAMRMLLDEIESRSTPPDLSSLIEIWYGTSPIAPELVERAVRLLGCGFRQQYGMTEAQMPVTGLDPGDHVVGSPQLASAGRVLPGWDVRVVDSDLRDVPEGEPGELLIRGPTLFAGYWDDPERTAEVMVDGWYRTGDVGRFDDAGFVYIVDRTKDMIVSGGENVYPAEVEATLRNHPDIDHVAVIGIPSDRWGEAVHAVIVPVAGHEPVPSDVIEWARARLAHFKCPASISVVTDLPLNATGKVDKRALRAPFWQQHIRAVN